MRPPIPSLTLSRRSKILLAVVGILIVLLIVASSLTGVYVNWLWFGEVGYRQVYGGMLRTRIILFLVFGLLMALIIGGNLVIAYLLRPPFRPMSTEQQNLERYRVVIEPRKKLILGAVAVLAFFTAGMSAQSKWATWLLWLHGGRFGVKDPQFHKDISFFAWDYPVYRLMLGFGFTAVIFSLILSIGVHYLSGAIRLQTPGPKITISARRHLTILVFVFMVLKALAYWLDRYGLVFSSRSTFTGASYTDVHASLPAKAILFWIAVLIAAGVLASLWLRSAMLPGIAFISMLVLSILISGIYPALLQQISVKPNASDKEAPYILKNITATRQAYGIVSAADGGQVNYVNYPINNSPSQTALTKNTATVSNIRLLDPNLLAPTFQQLQQIKNQYGFPAKLDIDRYTVGGVTRDYVLGVRELDAANLKDNQNNWINKHTVYTHGYGFVAAQANESLNPDYNWAESNIPPVGFLDITQPRVYYGELGVDYSIVGATGSREYDGSDQTTSYRGKGGVSLNNVFTRLAFAVKYKQTNFLLNDAVSAKGAKVIFNRDPRARVLKIAPFLKADGDPYPAVVDGRIVWIVDGYTTMANYPYSERQTLSDLTDTALSKQNKTESQPSSKINYIRNSVKATVDAYDGTVKLYQWDQQDPVLKAWMKVFPKLVQPRSAMPAGVLAHVRYPEDLFLAQRKMLEQYHVDDPVTFYNVRDKWTVPTDPTSESGGNQPPYYLVADKPMGNGTTPEFQLTSPMKVNNREYLAGYISVNSEPGPDYGKMTVLKLPSQANVSGPGQVFNKFAQEPAITRDLTLFNQGGSTVLHGNLLTLPVGGTFLYVEPLYVQRSSGTSAFPALDAILVSYGDQLGYGSSVSDALTHLAPAGQVPQLRTSVGGGAPPTSASPTKPPTTPPSTSSPAPSTTAPASQAALLAQVNQAFTELQDAYRSGDFAAVGTAQAKLQRLVSDYLAKYGSTPSTSATPSPSPSR